MAKKGKYTYDWPRPMVTVDAVVFAVEPGKTSVLLIERGNEPFLGQWAFPGGFLELDEELQTAAARELKEETGISITNLTQLYTAGGIGRDPRGRQITIIHTAVINGPPPTPTPGDDAAKAKWFNIENQPPMAFDHNQILEDAISHLKLLKN